MKNKSAKQKNPPPKKLRRKTLLFIAEGAPKGAWNSSLFAAACDLFDYGCDEDSVVALLSKPTGHLDSRDMSAIKSAWKATEFTRPLSPEAAAEVIFLQASAMSTSDFADVSPSAPIETLPDGRTWIRLGSYIYLWPTPEADPAEYKIEDFEREFRVIAKKD